MAFIKVSSADITSQGMQGQSDLLTVSAANKKLAFDALATRVGERLNGVIDRLIAITADNSGADNIGSAPIDGVTGETIHAQLVDIKSQLTDITLGLIPDGTLTKAKFSDFDGDVGASKLTGYEKPSSTSALSALDTQLQALGKLEKATENINTLVTNLSNGLSAGTTIPAKAADVTTTLNGVALTSIFETGGTVAKSATNATNATSATRATYASTDTSKGTIETRLTNLGFRSGSITVPSGYTASENTVTRQGNYVIGKYIVDIPNGTTLSSTVLGTLPTYFRPMSAKEQYCFAQSYPSYYSNGINLDINTNGQIVSQTYTTLSEQYRLFVYFGFSAPTIG